MSLFLTQFSPSPVLTAAPHSTHHRPGANSIRSVSYPITAGLGRFPVHDSSVAASPATPRGRKRSRDEAAINLDSFTQSEPAYGYSTTPPKQDASMSSHAYQPASFHVDPPKQLDVFQPPSDRPALRSHKSQRLDQAAISARHDAAATGTNADEPAESRAPPIVDDFTIHLGIGWRRISDDVDIQAAARGWARFIENNYPVSSAKICLESKGLQSYLVEAAEGYFLFAENLRFGRLVGHDVKSAIANLKTSPPSSPGAEMVAGQAALLNNGLGAIAHDAALAPAVPRTDMDMDH